jgi:hypothetical protein
MVKTVGYFYWTIQWYIQIEYSILSQEYKSVTSPHYHQGNNEQQHNNDPTYASSYSAPPNPRAPRHQERATRMYRSRERWRHQVLRRRRHKRIPMLQRLHLERTGSLRALTRPQRQHVPAPAMFTILLGFHQPPTNEPTPRRDKPNPEQRPSGVGILSLPSPFLTGLTCTRAFRERAHILL